MADRLDVVLFFACCATIGIASFLFFQFNKNASLKKRVFRWGHLFAGAIFLGFIAWLGAPPPAFLLAIATVILVTFLSIWGTKFCPHCGKTLFHAYRVRFCTHCGQSLNSGGAWH